jgi:hypothetical protein
VETIFRSGISVPMRRSLTEFLDCSRHIKLFGNKMYMHIVLHVNILPNITRLEIRFCTLHLKNIV